VDARVFQAEPNRILVRLERLATGDVDPIAGGAKGRDELAKRGVQIRRHCHQRQIVVDAGIRQ
jgi:hypothetical protein